jgi:hypothetical protein
VADVRFTRLALDGSAVEIVSSEEPARVYTADVMTRLHQFGGRRQRFAAGPIDFGMRTAFDPDICVGMRLDQEFDFQGGRLRLGWGTQPIGPDGVDYWEISAAGELRRKPFRILVWEGRNHSMYAHMYGGEGSDLLEAISQFTVKESGLGITCIPNNPRATPFIRGPSVIQEMPTIGLIHIRELTKRTISEVPKKKGTKVRGGELFVARPDGPERFFLLAGKSSLTQLMPEEDIAIDDVLSRIETLDVTWKRAS